MKDYSEWMNPQTNQQQQKQEVFQQYQYDAKYKVAYEEMIRKYSAYLHEIAPYLTHEDIEHVQFKHMLGGYYLQGFYKRYGKQLRRFIFDRDGKWFEAPALEWASLGHETNDDTIKAFIIDMYHEYWRNKQ